MSAHEYGSAKEALKDLTEAYNYWSGRLTETSTVFALSLIAANWAVHGSDGIKAEFLPRLSIFSALLTLLSASVVALLMVVAHDKRHEYAEMSSERWQKEFAEAQADKSLNPWPYTTTIERIGWWGRLLKTVLPILGCVFFIASFV